MNSNSNKLNVVLFQPLIPQNTGSIARLTAATNLQLHLIKPFAFALSDTNLKRAGLDYWEETRISIYQSWEAFLLMNEIYRENGKNIHNNQKNLVEPPKLMQGSSKNKPCSEEGEVVSNPPADTELNEASPQTSRLHLISTKGTKTLYQAEFHEGDYLVFGNESRGLPQPMHQAYSENRILIPMENPNIRSLNLATSVGIVVYWALGNLKTC